MSQPNTSRGFINGDFKNIGDDTAPGILKPEIAQSQTPDIFNTNINANFDERSITNSKGNNGDKMTGMGDTNLFGQSTIKQTPQVRSEMSSGIFSPPTLFNNEKSMDFIMESRKRKMSVSHLKKAKTFLKRTGGDDKSNEESGEECLSYSSEIDEFEFSTKSDKEDPVEVKFSAKLI